ncbi:MAG: RNA methyltransferase [Chloroflexi bacterium]|nr:MAG: RNA methyltransferase [Chloroflexota bacterium]
MDITSLQNPRVKHIVRLREEKKQRQKDGLILVEGFDELTLAVECGHEPLTLLSAPELASRTLSFPRAEQITVSRAVFEKISYRENPDGWLGILPMPSQKLEDITLSGIPLVLLVESVEKPGNLGAILRTADAANVDAVLVCDPRVDVWNPNVIRASRGAVFAVTVAEVDSRQALVWLRSGGMRVIAATPSAREIYTNVDMKEPIAIAVGTEDEGLTDFWLENADARVKIPMGGKVNSLNVSIAAALMAYEARRQRSL